MELNSNFHTLCSAEATESRDEEKREALTNFHSSQLIHGTSLKLLSTTSFASWPLNPNIDSISRQSVVFVVEIHGCSSLPPRKKVLRRRRLLLMPMKVVTQNTTAKREMGSQQLGFLIFYFYFFYGPIGLNFYFYLSLKM